MKRWTLLILLCLLIGLVTNCVVVFRFAFIPPDDLSWPLSSTWAWKDNEHDRPWSFTIHQRVGITFVRSDGLTRGNDQGYDGQPTVIELPPDLPSWSQSHDKALRASDFNRIMIRELAMGWPLRSSRYYAVWLRNYDDPTKSQHLVQGAWFYPTSVVDQLLGSNLAMPLIPIWSGLLFNVFFYSVIWFGVFLGFSKARQAIRRKHGRCPMCGYDLRGDVDAGCPECGWCRD